MHPSEKVTLRDSALAGKRIVIGITGSIAAVETVRLIRELLRHGAEVIPVMSRDAQNIVHPWSVEFGAGRPPITEITGQVEHVLYCGDPESAVDLMLVCPATANTISKIACGIDDTPVTTFATTALGTGIPLLVCPSMHGTMYDHPVVMENITRLRSMGVGFVDPRVSEGKAKLPSREEIVEHVIRTLSIHELDSLAGERVLIVGGNTAQPLDAMRVLTGRASGGTAVSLAVQAFRRGADVELWYGRATTPVPGWIAKVERFTTVDDLMGLTNGLGPENPFDCIIVCAAISDYTPEPHDGKIPSGRRSMGITLTPTPKVIEHIRRRAPDACLVGFKAEAGVSVEELVLRAASRMKEIGCDLMVANLLEDVGDEASRAVILDGEGDTAPVEGSRYVIAASVLDTVSVLLDANWGKDVGGAEGEVNGVEEVWESSPDDSGEMDGDDGWGSYGGVEETMDDDATWRPPETGDTGEVPGDPWKPPEGKNTSAGPEDPWRSQWTGGTANAGEGPWEVPTPRAVVDAGEGPWEAAETGGRPGKDGNGTNSKTETTGKGDPGGTLREPPVDDPPVRFKDDPDEPVPTTRMLKPPNF